MNERYIMPNELLLGEVCAQLSKGNRVKIRAKGNSMRPFIRGDEDILLLAPTSRSLRRGDIVLARLKSCEYVVHRIVKIDRNCIHLSGDGNLFQKEKCDKKYVFGMVEMICRHSRYLKLTNLSFRLLALGWYLLLPFRRLKYKILRKIRK